RMDYTAIGDTTNVAARLQQAAEPGRVTISDATHRLVQGYFDTRSIGEMHLKNREEPVVAWEVLAAREARTRLELETTRGLTPSSGASASSGCCSMPSRARGPVRGRSPSWSASPGSVSPDFCSSSGSAWARASR